MMYRIFSWMVCVVFAVSCEAPTYFSQEVDYSFGDVTVKRVDREHEATLYYMENGQRVDSVWSFLNNRFMETIIFDADKRVWLSNFYRFRDTPDAGKFMVYYPYDGSIPRAHFECWDTWEHEGRIYTLLCYPARETRYNKRGSASYKTLVRVTPIWQSETSAK